MTNQADHIQQFFQHHPGPFDFLESSDSVDGIMAVDCKATDSYIIAAHFWDRHEQERSELIAEAVAFALNMLSSRQTFRWKPGQLPKAVQKLLEQYPGPFVCEVVADGWDECSFVRCLATGELVVKETRRRLEDSEIVTATVANALNQLRTPQIHDKTKQLLSMLRCRV